MVRWYHAIFTAYGFWLPNDPRGSWSTFVASWELRKFGDATKTDVRHSVAHTAHDVQQRRAAKQALKFPPVRFDEPQRHAIAAGIAQACRESDISVYACAIGFDHVHAVVGRHVKSIERVIGQFKGRATQHLTATGIYPMERFAEPDKPLPSCWAEGCWSVFIDDECQLGVATEYVRRHPMKEGLPPQNWPFIRPSPM